MKFYGLAFELVALNLALILGGYYLDGFLSTSPIFILVGTFLAMAGTIWLLLKALK
ncbi:AtpZ/AtpI family protein [Ekhidna sp.]|uniref:AtpZ/AtpI family protein n=1 Tax=Ekhidna sp. TaxID=2608089 RepID=UPI0035189BCF